MTTLVPWIKSNPKSQRPRGRDAGSSQIAAEVTPTLSLGHSVVWTPWGCSLGLLIPFPEGGHPEWGLASISHVPSTCCLRSEGEPVRGKGTGTGMRQKPGVSRQVLEDQAPSCLGAPREGCPGGRRLLRVGRWG